MKKLLFPALLVIALLTGCKATQTANVNGASTPTKPPQHTAVVKAKKDTDKKGSCNAQLWQHVYHPDRLKVIRKCMTVTGLVEGVRREPDGDIHIQLAVKNSSLINSANRSYEDGDLVLEEICQGAITQADAVGPCRGVPHNMLVPIVGVEATVTGSYVLDQDHGWMEIHPVTSVSIGAPPGAAGVGPQRHHHHFTIVPVDIDPVHHHRVHHIATGAWCTADAVYNSYYNDWDVYVHSNQFDKTVIVTGGGYTKKWYTNSQGYADVYWDGKPGAPALVTVGAATCSA